ncbi:MFS transporter [Elizabethkingia anophelis]|uniref:MFS transporter n=1 Tax=Elizabethkingia anophelis TaxID=1117645 RepID=UPI000666F271|nr:MFS transporter [Elizabethkingia anophelis]AQW92668.1 MFS transporter [Elizabethkingia anophelis]KUY14811.1 MFS transporter [Elizabethkingia anophelis]MCT3726711.1 MFS transporter [Elizabethkingia anophelis]MCT4320183.1 MFS transporter [Elizabethkingia anophelis]MDV3747777.1 MFS transporter [Elizabethkingia anophelis]
MLSIVMLINRSGSMVLPFLGVYMTDQLEFSIKESGIVLSFYGVGSVIGSWLGGYFTDKFGEYRVQSTSLFLSAPLFLLIPIFTSVEGMALIILLQSIISETFRPANSVAITKYARPENLTRAFSLNRMAINLGFSIGPALGGILSSVSYELLFITNAVGAILAGIFYVRFFRKRHKIYQKKMKEKSMVKDTLERERSPYRDSPFLVYCLLCAIFSVCFFQFFNTIPIFYKEVAHLDQKSIGYILGYSGFIIVVLEMLVVNFADKYLTIAKTLLYGILMCAAAYAMLAINHHISLIMLSISILSVGEILVLPFMSTITALRSGKTNQGAYMGLNGMTFSISFIITPLLGTSVASDLGFNTLWIGSGVVLALAGIAMYFVVNWLLPGMVKAAH